MLTLLSTFMSFFAGGLPKLLAFFQSRSDNSHELDMARLQNERELALAAQGFAAQQRIEEIKTDQVEMQTQAQERVALYEHDAKIGEGASRWIINLRASVRPIITYIFVLELLAVNAAGFWYAWQTNVPFNEMLTKIFSEDEMQILSSIVAFWFGTQAFQKK
jgi:hypothetical protein